MAKGSMVVPSGFHPKSANISVSEGLQNVGM